MKQLAPPPLSKSSDVVTETLGETVSSASRLSCSSDVATETLGETVSSASRLSCSSDVATETLCVQLAPPPDSVAAQMLSQRRWGETTRDCFTSSIAM